MRSYISIIFITFLAILFTKCKYLDEFEKGNGVMVTERRAMPDFNELKIGGNFEVLLKHGSDAYIQINTDENLLDFIDAEVQDGTLIITQEKKLISKKKIELVIQYLEVREIRVMGAAYLSNEGYLETQELEIRMDGAGIIDLKLKTRSLQVVLSGAGMVKLAGDVIEQNLNLTGAGKLEAFDLDSRECKISVGGLGGAEISVTKKLEARIEGIGGIEYAGNPDEIITEINGLGKIEPSEIE